MPPFRKHPTTALAGARQAVGLTIEDLADAAGVSPRTVARAERDRPVRPTELAAIRMAVDAYTPTSTCDYAQRAADVAARWLTDVVEPKRADALTALIRLTTIRSWRQL